LPKEITHWTLAAEAFERLRTGSPLKGILASHPNLYRIGAVILDSPFYVQWGKGSAWIRSRSEQIHDTENNPFEAVWAIFDDPHPLSMDAEVSLLAGITTHIFSDAVFHPFVCHVSGALDAPEPRTRKKSKIRHHTLETYLDLFFEQKGLFSTKNDSFVRFFNSIEISRSSLLKILCRLFGAGNPEETALVRKAVTWHAFLQSLFHQSALNGFLRACDLLPGMNLKPILASFYPSRTPPPEQLFPQPVSFRHPVTGEARHVPVRILEREALEKIQSAFETLDDALRYGSPRKGFPLLKGPNLYTGMPGRRMSDMRYFNDTAGLMALIRGKSAS